MLGQARAGNFLERGYPQGLKLGHYLGKLVVDPLLHEFEGTDDCIVYASADDLVMTVASNSCMVIEESLNNALRHINR